MPQIHRHFIFRQVTGSGKQAVLFVLCVILSMVILVALNGFSESVDRMMETDARKLHGGDIIVQSRFAFSEPLDRAVGEIARSGQAQSIRTYEFYSMAMDPSDRESLLARIKVVEPGYPLYGRVGLKSGNTFHRVLTPGKAVVERGVLERLGIGIGDRLRIGRAVLAIGDVVESEPDRPVNVFSFGPRIFVSSADLTAMDLVGKGSRITYKALIKVRDERRLREFTDTLNRAAIPDQERIDTFRTARSRLKRFFDNFFFFLNLVGTFTLVLAGIGIYSSLTAFLREKEKTIAIMKIVGATGRFVTVQYLAVLLFLGVVGTCGGILLGIGLEYLLPFLFSGLLPESLKATISPSAIVQGFVLGLVIVALFAFLPVYRLKEIKPAAILRKEPVRFRKNAVTYAVIGAILVFFAVVIVEKVEDLKTGGYFLMGIAGLIGIAALVSGPILWLLKRISVKPLGIRQAIKGLFRPGNATRAVIVTMTASLTFIFSIYLVEQNLNEAFIASYPPDAPNLFFLDIQPDQKQRFSDAIGLKTSFYPIVRAKILSVNGRPVDRNKERKRRRDNLARTFNLTYRHHLLDDEIVVDGGRLFPENFDGLPVSILDRVAEIPDPELKIGDRIRFRIQGLPLSATVTSIRSRTKESLSPFFYFVFPESVLKQAPQTAFAAARVAKERIPELQNRMVAQFPNLTVIDATASAERISKVLKQLSAIVRFFTLFSIIAGILLIISSVYATRFARIQEAVYYKVLGAGSGFVMAVFAVENLLLGLISGGLALVLSHGGSWFMCHKFLEIPYQPFLRASTAMVLSAVAMALIAGLLPSVSIIRQKPMGFLKAQTDE